MKRLNIALTTLALILLANTAASALDVGSMVQGIRDGLRRSPDHFMAGIVELRGRTTCSGARANRLCWIEAYVVEEFSSRRPGSSSFPKMFLQLASGDPGTVLRGRHLVFAIPLPGTGVYGSTLSMNHTPQQETLFREAVRIAIEGKMRASCQRMSSTVCS